MKLWKFTTLIETEDELTAKNILRSIASFNSGDGCYMHTGGEELHPELKEWPLHPELKLIKRVKD